MSSVLFSPYRLAALDLDNRVVISPMCQYSADDGVANDWHFSHLAAMANSGAALVIVEATHVERHGRITHGCLGLYSDDCEAAIERPGLARRQLPFRKGPPRRFGGNPIDTQRHRPRGTLGEVSRAQMHEQARNPHERLP